MDVSKGELLVYQTDDGEAFFCRIAEKAVDRRPTDRHSDPNDAVAAEVDYLRNALRQKIEDVELAAKQIGK